MNCARCSSALVLVCMDCSIEYCQKCDQSTRIHSTHKKQRIDSVIGKCKSIRITIADEEKFTSVKDTLLNVLEQGIQMMTTLSKLQQSFEKTTQDAEYHCELLRLSRKYEETNDQEELKDILSKILSKSKKCQFQLDEESTQRSALDQFNSLQKQLVDQEKLSKNMQVEIQKLQTSIKSANAQLQVNGQYIPSTGLQDVQQYNRISSETTNRTPIRNTGGQSLTPIRNTRSNNNNTNNYNSTTADEYANTRQTTRTSRSSREYQEIVPSPLPSKKLKKNLQNAY